MDISTVVEVSDLAAKFTPFACRHPDRSAFHDDPLLIPFLLCSYGGALYLVTSYSYLPTQVT